MATNTVGRSLLSPPPNPDLWTYFERPDFVWIEMQFLNTRVAAAGLDRPRALWLDCRPATSSESHVLTVDIVSSVGQAVEPERWVPEGMCLFDNARDFPRNRHVAGLTPDPLATNIFFMQLDEMIARTNRTYVYMWYQRQEAPRRRPPGEIPTIDLPYHVRCVSLQLNPLGVPSERNRIVQNEWAEEIMNMIEVTQDFVLVLYLRDRVPGLFSVHHLVFPASVAAYEARPFRYVFNRFAWRIPVPLQGQNAETVQRQLPPGVRDGPVLTHVNYDQAPAAETN